VPSKPEVVSRFEPKQTEKCCFWFCSVFFAKLKKLFGVLKIIFYYRIVSSKVILPEKDKIMKTLKKENVFKNKLSFFAIFFQVQLVLAKQIKQKSFFG
jgi:hypothetical protein